MFENAEDKVWNKELFVTICIVKKLNSFTVKIKKKSNEEK